MLLPSSGIACPFLIPNSLHSSAVTPIQFKFLVLLINFEKRSARAKPLLSQLGILDFEEIFNLECSKLIYDINGTQSAMLDNFFEKTTPDMAITLANSKQTTRVPYSKDYI